MHACLTRKQTLTLAHTRTHSRRRPLLHRDLKSPNILECIINACRTYLNKRIYSHTSQRRKLAHIATCTHIYMIALNTPLLHRDLKLQIFLYVFNAWALKRTNKRLNKHVHSHTSPWRTLAHVAAYTHPHTHKPTHA